MISFKYVYRYDLGLYMDVGDNVPEGEISSAKERVQKLKELYQELQQQIIKVQKYQTKYYYKCHTSI